ncbi:MAG: hypothetical protein TREMPRED_004221, partial [Tremellales sp. Tagirdzhanova-0007]
MLGAQEKVVALCLVHPSPNAMRMDRLYVVQEMYEHRYGRVPLAPPDKTHSRRVIFFSLHYNGPLAILSLSYNSSGPGEATSKEEETLLIKILDELCDDVYILAALRFSADTSIEGKQGFEHRMIENVAVAQAPFLAKAPDSSRDSLLRHGLIRSHRLVYELSKNMLPGMDSRTLLHIITVLRAMAKLGMLECDSDEIELIRQVLTYVVLLTATGVRHRGMDLWDDECFQAVREAAVYLALYEGHLSAILGRKSLISRQTFELLCPSPKVDHQSTIRLDHLEPLLHVDDGVTGIDPVRHLRSILSTTIHEIFHLQRTIVSSEAEDPTWFVVRRAKLDQSLQTVDALFHAIYTTTRREDGRVISKRARTLLRSLACMELCCVQHSMTLAVIAFRTGEPLSQKIAYSLVVGDLDRMRRIVLLFQPDTPLSEIYHILDLVVQIVKLCSDLVAQDILSSIPSDLNKV